MRFLLISLLMLSGFIYSNAQNYNISTIKVHFDVDDYTINDLNQKKIDNLCISLKNAYNYSIRIKAGTDIDGSTAYNKLLSEQRANAVLEVLNNKQVDLTKCQVISLGESQANGTDELEKVKDRFCELEIKVPYYSDLDEFIESQKKYNTFFYNNESRKFTGEKGFEFHIPDEAFENMEGIPVKNAKINIIEATQNYDYFLNNLSTVSGEKF